MNIVHKAYRAVSYTHLGIGRDENKFRDFSEKLGENVSRFSYRLFDVGNREGSIPAQFTRRSGLIPLFVKKVQSSVHPSLFPTSNSR